MVTDLVCKMEIDEKTASYSLVFDNKTYYFCSEGCRAEFMRHMQEYVNPPTSDDGHSEEYLNV